MSITSWTMNVHCISNVIIPMIVALRLISSMMRRGVGACGVKRRSYQILSNDVTFKARPLCNLRYGNVIFQRKLDIMIAKASNIDGLNILFQFIFIPICILKIK